MSTLIWRELFEIPNECRGDRTWATFGTFFNKSFETHRKTEDLKRKFRFHLWFFPSWGAFKNGILLHVCCIWWFKYNLMALTVVHMTGIDYSDLPHLPFLFPEGVLDSHELLTSRLTGERYFSSTADDSCLNDSAHCVSQGGIKFRVPTIHRSPGN